MQRNTLTNALLAVIAVLLLVIAVRLVKPLHSANASQPASITVQHIDLVDEHGKAVGSLDGATGLILDDDKGNESRILPGDFTSVNGKSFSDLWPDGVTTTPK